MILVDKQIRELINNGMLIINGYNEDNLECVSYDLTIDKIISDHEYDEYLIKPGEFVMVKTNEELKIPNNMVGHIKEKNSLLRIGLMVTGPMYQPGHQTYGYFRVYNMSQNKVMLNKNFKIAQIVFEVLGDVPEVTYNENEKSSFNNEKEYIGYGKYTESYKKLIK